MASDEPAMDVYIYPCIDCIMASLLQSTSLSSHFDTITTRRYKFFKMDNSDIIARIYPHNTGSTVPFQAIAASPLCNHPHHHFDETPYNRNERERTEPPEETDGPQLCAEIRFSNIPRTGRGVLIGSDPDCDIVVPRKGISLRHISITFDDQKRLIVKDWGSLMGIQVTYDSLGVGTRRKFQWIVGGHQVPDKKTSIILELHKAISFRITVPYHDISCPDYIEKVNRFGRGAASAEYLLEDLDLISRPRTELPTGANTPGTGAIYVKKRLGEGSFGAVTYLWNVSTGQEYALKKPSEKAMMRGDVSIAAWLREARIMRQVSHASIPPLICCPCYTNF